MSAPKGRSPNLINGLFPSLPKSQVTAVREITLKRERCSDCTDNHIAVVGILSRRR
ncbi:MAG: hypothetical protein KME06_02030 [Kastovskya adunca ATA6-11-RM4]|nr:hypothetical protein [Kastovskya adunca ATA6-11-RM4]